MGLQGLQLQLQPAAARPFQGSLQCVEHPSFQPFRGEESRGDHYEPVSLEGHARRGFHPGLEDRAGQLHLQVCQHRGPQRPGVGVRLYAAVPDRDSLCFLPFLLVSRAMLVRLVLRLGLLAFLGLPGRSGVLQLPCPFAAVPLVPVDGVVDVIPFALDPRPELTRQQVDLVLCFLWRIQWRIQVRSDSRFPAIQLLAMRFRQFGSDAGRIVFAGPGRLVPEGPWGGGSVRGCRG